MTAEHEMTSPADAPDHSPEVSAQSPRVDASTIRSVLRALIARLRAVEASGDLSTGPPRSDAGDSSTFVLGDYIYSHEASDDEMPLSVVLLAGDHSSALLNDALVALDAQSDTDFELIVVASSSLESDIERVERLLAAFSSGLAARSRLVAAPLRYITILDATDIVFGHFVATFASMARTSPAAVLRARAITQPMRELTWPDGHAGFEPTGAAESASAPRFSILEHLSQGGTPPGSYALQREYFNDLGPVSDEDSVLLEAAVLGGVHESPGEVIVLMRRFDQ